MDPIKELNVKALAKDMLKKYQFLLSITGFATKTPFK